MTKSELDAISLFLLKRTASLGKSNVNTQKGTKWHYFL